MTLMPEFITATTEQDYREARTLMREYEMEIEGDLCFQGFEQELDTVEQVYGPPGGRFHIVRHESRTAGCVALRDLGDGGCEMKRLFLRPDFRGIGLGRVCADRIVETAQEMDYATVRLDTLPSMRAAIALYRSMGFAEIGDHTHKPVHGAVSMELVLRRDSD